MTEGEVVTPKWFYQKSMVFKYMDSPTKNFGNDDRRGGYLLKISETTGGGKSFREEG